MGQFATLYGGMAAMTALYLFLDVRPLRPGDWLGLVAISLLWPAAFGVALYAAITRTR